MMPAHVGCAYQDAADGVRFLQLQQWVATAYALIIYGAIFIISAHYFSRTDFARNFTGEERIGLGLEVAPSSPWSRPEAFVGLIVVSLIAALLTAIYLWSVR